MTLQLKKAAVAVVVGVVMLLATDIAAYATPGPKHYVARRYCDVFPSLDVLERYEDVLEFRPHRLNRFRKRNDVISVSKGTRMVKVLSVSYWDGFRVYKVRIPSLNRVGYVYADDLRRAKKKKKKHYKKDKQEKYNKHGSYEWNSRPILIIDM